MTRSNHSLLRRRHLSPEPPRPGPRLLGCLLMLAAAGVWVGVGWWLVAEVWPLLMGRW